MSTWSSELTSVSEEHNAFTLSNPIKQSQTATFTRNSNLKSLFVVTGVIGSLPTEGKKRIKFQLELS